MNVFQRKWIINRKFQRTFLLHTVLSTLVVIIINVVTVWYFFRQSYFYGKAMAFPNNHAYFFLLQRQTHIALGVGIVGGLVILIALTVMGVLFSHRIAGPLFRIQRHMNEIADGKPIIEIEFRKNDFFREIADAFNRVANRLK